MRAAIMLCLGALALGSPALAMDGGGGADMPSGLKSRAYLDGERAVKAKEYAKAVPLLELAINQDIRDADAQNLMGYAQRKLGNKDGALAYYARAIQLEPAHRGANEYLGELYVELNDMPKAELQLTKLQQLCGGTSCEEYRDLKALIDQARATPPGPRPGS